MKQKPKEGNKSKRSWKRKSFNVVKLSAGVFLQTIKSKYYKKYCFCGLHHRHHHHQQTQFEIHSMWNMTVLSLIVLTIEAYAILSFIVKREIIKLFEIKSTRKTIEKYQNNKGNNQTNNGKSREKNERKCK